MGSFKDKPSRQVQSSGTSFNTDFTSQFNKIFGSPTTANDLLTRGGLPTTRSLFGGQQVGIMPSTGGPSASVMRGAGAGDPRQFGAAPAAGGAPRGYDLATIQAEANRIWQQDPDRARKEVLEAQNIMNRTGSQTITAEQLRTMSGTKERSDLANALDMYGSIQQGQQNQAVPVATGVGAAPFDLGAAAKNLGFFDPNSVKRAGDPRADMKNIPVIQAQQAKGAQVNMSPGSFANLEKDLFESQFRPFEREFKRQGELDERALKSDLAQSGLASSGTGVGQVQQQREERFQQLTQQAREISSAASVQRFGLQYEQAVKNAELQQETSLKNAGFNLEAQVANAANVLTDNATRSEAYLKAIGIDADIATQMKNDFLKIAELEQKDLMRMEDSQLKSLGVLLDLWLQQGALMVNAGSESSGISTGAKPGWGGAIGKMFQPQMPSGGGG